MKNSLVQLGDATSILLDANVETVDLAAHRRERLGADAEQRVDSIELLLHAALGNHATPIDRLRIVAKRQIASLHNDLRRIGFVDRRVLQSREQHLPVFARWRKVLDRLDAGAQRGAQRRQRLSRHAARNDPRLETAADIDANAKRQRRRTDELFWPVKSSQQNKKPDNSRATKPWISLPSSEAFAAQRRPNVQVEFSRSYHRRLSMSCRSTTDRCFATTAAYFDKTTSQMHDYKSMLFRKHEPSVDSIVWQTKFHL